MAYILFFHDNPSSSLSGSPFFALPLVNQIMAALFIVHYLNRAVISPLFLAPSMSSIHAIIIFFAVLFNYMNAAVISGWLLGYGVVPMETSIVGDSADVLGKDPVETDDAGPMARFVPCTAYVGLAVFLVGMYGNIGAENTLFRLRRDEAHRRAAATGSEKANGATNNKDDKNKNIYSKVYIIPPPKGFFRYVLHPHYSLEWLEWTGYMIMGFAVHTADTRASLAAAGHTVSAPAPPIPLALFYAPLANLLDKLGLPFPFPAIVFLVNSVMNTAARASWGRKWYEVKFGKEAVAGRAAAVPFIL